MIASHFLQVFIVVQPLDDGRRYRVSVTRRADVPDFPPSLPVDGIFDVDDEALAEWLLAKLINAEHACYGTKKLSEMQNRTRATLFEVRFEYDTVFYSISCLSQSSSSSSILIQVTE